MCSNNAASDADDEGDISGTEEDSITEACLNLEDNLEPEQNASLIVHRPLQIVVWSGFKLVADNVDKNFRPSFHRYSDNYTNNSMHSFHIYAVQDRIDLSSYSDINPNPSIDVTKLLISKVDIDQLKENVSVLLERYDHSKC